MTKVSNQERIDNSNQFNARILAHIEEFGPQSTAQLSKFSGCEPRPLRAKLARMAKAGAIHSRSTDGAQSYHVLYHAGPEQDDEFISARPIISSSWATGGAKRDPLVAAFFGSARA